MGYSFQAGEPVAGAVRRVAKEQLDRAVEALSGESGHLEVHEARKNLKKVRALLRLVQDRLDTSFDEENSALRDAGRRLSPLRDAEALVEAFDALRVRFGDELPQELYDFVREALVKRQDRIAQQHNDVQATTAEVRNTLRDVRRRAGKWKLTARGFDALKPGFRDIFRRARKSMAEAYANPADERFHEWRKRVKDHWYHVRLLSDAWPAMLEVRETALKELSDMLGDDHDMTVLREILQNEPALLPDAEAGELFAKVIERRKSELREEAELFGRRLFAGTPKSQGRQMQAYWDTWKTESGRGRS
jgi:CHAD domain-containing protein